MLINCNVTFSLSLVLSCHPPGEPLWGPQVWGAVIACSRAFWITHKKDTEKNLNRTKQRRRRLNEYYILCSLWLDRRNYPELVSTLLETWGSKLFDCWKLNGIRPPNVGSSGTVVKIRPTFFFNFSSPHLVMSCHWVEKPRSWDLATFLCLGPFFRFQIWDFTGPFLPFIL